MKKLLSVLRDRRMFFLWFAVFAAAFIYGLYAFFYTFLDWNDLLLVGLNALLAGGGFAGVFLLLFAAKKEREPKTGKDLLLFAGGLVGFEAVLWVILSVVNVDGLYNRRAIHIAYAVVTVLFTAFATALFIRLAKSVWKPLCIVLAVLCLPALLVIAVTPAKTAIKTRLFELRSETDLSFAPIEASAVAVTDAERERCRDWYEKHILLTGEDAVPAFNFRIGDTDLRTLFAQGDFKAADPEKGTNSHGGQTTAASFASASRGITVTVDSAFYEEAATCEWTVTVRSTLDRDTDVISDFFAADCVLDGAADSVYYSRGSSNAAEDFLLSETAPGLFGVEFESTEGRSSDRFLPYFNFSGENGGVVAGIGWTGMWKLTADRNGNVTIGQKKLEGCLTPGESIRSPLVSLSFYDGENAVKGFNTFRQYITDCVYPDWAQSCTMLETAGPASTRTSDEILETLATFDDSVYKNVDYFWMDAGWYEYTDNWSDGVGNWTYDRSRYDNGIAELAAYGRQKGVGQVLWYEPERVLKDTLFYKKGMENEGWLLDVGSDTWCFNLANDEAREWFTETLAASMKENGVTFYRQDQNFDLAPFFEAGDAAYYGGRTGFCENHYIVGEYRYLDALTEAIPGLAIDNCASGGRRLDLEMARRSIPIWRSDYNCDPHPDLMEATQSQTLGISCWLPLTGTLKYCNSRYEAATSLIPCYIETFGTVGNEFFNSYDDLRQTMADRYYPLECGGLRTDRFLSMEYTSDDGSSGFTVSFRRENCASDTLDLVFSGLIPEKTYVMHDYYAPEITFSKTGQELMTTGLKHTFTGCPDVIIIVFE